MSFPSGIHLMTAYRVGANTKNAKNSKASGCKRSESSQGFTKKAYHRATK